LPPRPPHLPYPTLFRSDTTLADIHPHTERALIDRLGDTGRKLHTGRSRNDQVVTDVKLWVRDAIDELTRRLIEVQRSFLDAADQIGRAHVNSSHLVISY